MTIKCSLIPFSPSSRLAPSTSIYIIIINYYFTIHVNYFAFDEAEVHVLLADEAEDEIIDWLCNIVHGVHRYEEGLQSIIFEGFLSELNVFVTDVS